MALMQEKKYAARLPRTPFDLSQQIKFTTPLGVLSPVWEDIALPGDSYYFNTDALVRINNLLKPALTEFDFSVDYFFVPMTMIYTPFQSIIYKTQDVLSSSYNSLFNDGYTDLPLFDFWNAYRSFMIQEEENFFDSYLINQSTQFESWPKSALRLFSMLRLPINGLLYGLKATSFTEQALPSTLLFQPKIFPWQLLAYHTIYLKHYRNEDFESDNIYIRNADRAIEEGFVDGLFSTGTGFNEFLRFTSCHYVPFQKDYFMEVTPAPLINSQSMLTNNPNLLGLFDNDNYTTGKPESLQPNPIGAASNDTTQVGLIGGSDVVTTQNIRKAFAMEKLLRTIGRSEKNYDSQVLAHFGFKVPHDVLHNISFLGGHDGFVKLGEVVATANTASDVTQDSNLGEMAGKGYGRMNGDQQHPQTQIKFTAPCHGVVMALYHITPKVVYNGGFDKLNSITSVNDLPTPELDNLGKQPLYNYEMSQDILAGGTWSSRRFGWQYRWQQYKQKYPFVSLAFHDNTITPNFNNWCSWVIENGFILNRTPQPQVDYFVPNTLDQYLVRPTLTDNVYPIAFETGWNEAFNDAPWLAFQYDPFIVDLSIKCKKVSVLSRTGEPSLNM